MTARGGTPSPQWERFVVTGKARARIRRFIHPAAAPAAIATRAARRSPRRSARKGVDGSEKALEPALKALKIAVDRRSVCRRRQRQYRRQGRGARRLSRAAPGGPRAAHAARHAAAAARRPRGHGRRASRHAGHAAWSPGMAVQLRRLLPSAAGRSHRRHRGDRQGRDDPHAGTARQLQSFAATPERFIDVDWDYDGVPPRGQGATPGYAGRDQRHRQQRARPLANITNAVPSRTARSSTCRSSTGSRISARVLVDVEVRDLRAPLHRDRRAARRPRHQSGRRARE